MALNLTIRNSDALTNGAPTTFSLERCGATIGRSPTVDWSLPDPSNVISSRHCEISFRQEQYILTDISTNGTIINGRPATGGHAIIHGDVIVIGHYEIAAQLVGGSAQPEFAQQHSPASGGWDSHIPAGPVGVDPASWDRPKPKPAISGMGSMSQHLAPATPISPAASGWDYQPIASDNAASGPAAHPGSTPESIWGKAPPTPGVAASPWSSTIQDETKAATAEDVWGKLANSNVVDWARGGFGQAPQPAQADPLGLNRAPAAVATPALAMSQQPDSIDTTSTPASATPVPVVTDAVMLDELLSPMGLETSQISTSDRALLKASGALLRNLVAGMVVMLEARARAKSQMGAQSTSLEFDGNNPLKFARTPEQALAQLLNPPERGFMTSERAIEDAFFDLQSHQMATLKAMQGALKATLNRFSPTAIRQRTEAGGILAQIVPGARDAALWRAYEKEFGGVAQGSDEAFMDVFAKEFRSAYEEQSAKRPRR